MFKTIVKARADSDVGASLTKKQELSRVTDRRGIIEGQDRVLWVSVGTTGFVPGSDEVIALGYLVEINGELIREEELEFKPTNFADISDEALKANGVELGELRTFPSREVGVGKFVSVLNVMTDGGVGVRDRLILAGWDINFQLQHLRSIYLGVGRSYFNKWFYGVRIEVQSSAAKAIRGGLQTVDHRFATVASSYKITAIGYPGTLRRIRAIRKLYLCLEDG